MDDFNIKNCFVFPIMMDETESKYNLEGLPSISMLIDLDWGVSWAPLASMAMEDLDKMIECTHGNGKALNNHIQAKKSLMPKCHLYNNLLMFVCLPVCLSVCLSDRLLLLNHLADLDETWHGYSLSLNEANVH